MRRSLIAALAALSASVAVAADGAGAAPPVRLGVYYYPGWSPNISMAKYPQPWVPIEAFPDRLPLKGEYSDSSPAVLRQQLDEMRAAGLSYVAFDSYAGRKGTIRSDQSIEAYLAVATAKDPKFTLLWDNAYNVLTSEADWDILVGNWVARYLRDPRFLRIEGQPLVFILSPGGFEKSAQGFGLSTAVLLARARSLGVAAGLSGIKFVAGSGPQPALITGWARARGYDALSDYNMGTADYAMPGTGYARRIAVYRRYWQAYQRADLPVILPITAGWDRKPWGGSREDGAIPTPAEFADHVGEALAILERGHGEIDRLGVICCWNEYGEGSILEPTRKDGDARLKALRAVLYKARR